MEEQKLFQQWAYRFFLLLKHTIQCHIIWRNQNSTVAPTEREGQSVRMTRELASLALFLVCVSVVFCFALLYTTNHSFGLTWNVYHVELAFGLFRKTKYEYHCSHFHLSFGHSLSFGIFHPPKRRKNTQYFCERIFSVDYAKIILSLSEIVLRNILRFLIKSD